MELSRHRILAVDATVRPSAEWAASVVQRAFESGRRHARFLTRIRDGIYGDALKAAVRQLGLRELVTASLAPLMNTHCERLTGTLRRERLDHVIGMGQGHAWRLPAEHAVCYNGCRSHRALGGDAPGSRTKPTAGEGRVVATHVLGGLHHT